MFHKRTLSIVMMSVVKGYTNNVALATGRLLPFWGGLAILVAALLLSWAQTGWAAEFTVERAPGSAERAGQVDPGQQSRLEFLKGKYFLTSVKERSAVLEEIRLMGTGDALAFTLELLRYPDIRVRRDAADAIKRWGALSYNAVFTGMKDPEIGWLCESIFVELGPRVSPYLIKSLGHSDPEFRGRAAYLLGRIEDPVAVGPLYKNLEDPDRDVRIQVIQALCNLRDERSLKAILDLFETGDAGLVDFILQGAEEFGARAAPSLQAALRAGSVKTRIGAALALGRLSIPETLPSLADALQDPEPSVRKSVVKALDSFHHISASEGLYLALTDADLVVQDYATTALARLYPEVYPDIMDRLKDADPDVRKNAITVLRKIGDKRAVPSIIRALDDPDVNVRMFAVAALTEFKDPRAIRGLIARMKVEKEVPWIISYAFMEIGEEAVDELLRATGDDSFCLTRNLLILQMGNTAMSTLHERARGGVEKPVRYNAIVLLGELGNPESVPVLADLLEDEEVGWIAANVMGNMGEPAWRALRRAAIADGPGADNARDAISRMTCPELYPELVDALGDDCEELRRAVSEPIIAAGNHIIVLLTEKMAQLEGQNFLDATEIICRIKDGDAVDPLNRVLFPEPGEPAVLEPDKLNHLRQQYARKGSLKPVVARLKSEMGVIRGSGRP